MSSSQQKARKRLVSLGAFMLLLVAFSLIGLTVTLVALYVPDSSASVLFAVAAFPSVVLLASACSSLLALVLAILFRRKFMSALTGIVIVAIVAITLPSVIAREAPASEVKGASNSSSLRILSWNTNQQDVTVEQIASLIRQYRANVVILPEYFTAVGRGSLADIARRNSMQIVGNENSAATALISKQLGTYRIDDVRKTPAWAGFVATSESAKAPDILVAHLQRPSLRSTRIWQQHINWVRGECKRRDNIVAAGDFNATLANLHGSSLGGCRDAAHALGQQPAATWPTAIPWRLGATIDHVFISGEWQPKQFAVLAGDNTTGSDHRPIFCVIARTP